MKDNRMFHIFAFAAAVFMIFFRISWADDLLITGNINGPQTYVSPEGVVFNDAVLGSTSDVSVTSTYAIHLQPGTRVLLGARLVARVSDNDGLSNICEIQYFGDLTRNPDDDEDGDGLTNAQECEAGTDPTFAYTDNDGDGLNDLWEISNFNNLSHDCDTDANGDGVFDCVEYRLGRDPNAADSQGPGLHYQYDDLGRITRIDRIPSR